MRRVSGFEWIPDLGWVREGLAPTLRAGLAAGGAVPPRAVHRPAGGRGPLRRLSLPDGGAGLVKHYRHGGLLAALLGDVYWQRPPRPWRELVATETARAAGVCAPEVLAALVRPLGAGPPARWLYRGDLVTRELPGRRSLAEALEAAPPAERRLWIEAAAAAVRTLHRAGIRHPDLNVGNLLAGAGADEPIAIVDFDRAAVTARPVGRWGRLWARRRIARSVAKLELPGLDRPSVGAMLRRAWREGAA